MAIARSVKHRLVGAIEVTAGKRAVLTKRVHLAVGHNEVFDALFEHRLVGACERSMAERAVSQVEQAFGGDPQIVACAFVHEQFGLVCRIVGIHAVDALDGKQVEHAVVRRDAANAVFERAQLLEIRQTAVILDAGGPQCFVITPEQAIVQNLHIGRRARRNLQGFLHLGDLRRRWLLFRLARRAACQKEHAQNDA